MTIENRQKEKINQSVSPLDTRHHCKKKTAGEGKERSGEDRRKKGREREEWRKRDRKKEKESIEMKEKRRSIVKVV